VKTIGGNKIFVEEKGRGVFLDFGMNFAKHGVFFEEFLTERSSRGIHDLAYLGLIPKANIYRSDLIPSDLNVAGYSKLDVNAVLLSHAHLDHCGNLGLLREDIPVVASNVSIAVLKALRDTSQPGIGSEISYFSKKNPIEGNGLVLESETSGCYFGRDFCCSNNISEKLRAFTSQRPGQDSPKARKKVQPGKLCCLQESDLPFEVHAYDVDHSIYGASAYLLKGEKTIAYTGDFRLHGKMADKTRNFLSKAKAASILIIEGTRINRKNDSATEETVFQKCLGAVEESKKLTVADFSARNFERLDMFIKIARETGKQLDITAKDAYMLHAMGCAQGDCQMEKEDIAIYKELKDRKKIKWETETVMDKWDDRYISHTKISNDPGEYVLCFSFFDLKHLLDIKPNGGAYIYSSSESFSEEQDIDFVRLWKWLKSFNMKSYGFTMVGDGTKAKPDFPSGYHASGHASEREIEEVIDKVDPDFIIPVHTEDSEWFKKRFDNTIIPEEGKPIKF